MAELFSQRIGIVPQKQFVQIDTMDDELRVSLWNTLTKYVWEMLFEFNSTFSRSQPNTAKKIAEDIWGDFFYKAIDDMPLLYDLGKCIRPLFFSFTWFRVYDLVDFIVNVMPENYSIIFIYECNRILKRELSGYRFVGTRILPLTSEVEIEEVNAALSMSKKYTQHLEKAIDLIADRQSPDYANSIKESISAVEATCQMITRDKNATLTDALKKIESRVGTFSPTLKKSLILLYNYTSDAQGIRHGMLGESSLDIDDAKFMLIACSAFINYILSKASSVGIQITIP